MKLQDIKPGTVFETKDGRRFVRGDHLDKSKKAQGQWECMSLDDGSHPKAFPEVNHEEVTPISYFDRGPIKPFGEIEVDDGTIIEVVEADAWEAFVGSRLVASRAPEAGGPPPRLWVDLEDGTQHPVLPPEVKVRVLHNILDPKTTEIHSDLQDRIEVKDVAHEALEALQSRLEEAFGPMGLTNPDGAEELLLDVRDTLDSILSKQR